MIIGKQSARGVAPGSAPGHAIAGPGHKWPGGSGVTILLETGKLSH